MKVGIVCAFDTYFDRVQLLKEFYQNKGLEVVVFASDFSHRKKEKVQKNTTADVWIPARPYHKNLSLARLYSHYVFSKQAAMLLSKETWDILHVLVPCNSLVYFITKLKEKAPQTKLIFDLIDLWPETMPISRFKDVFPFTIWKRLRDGFLDQADLIFTECKLYQEVLHREQDPKVHNLYWARQEVPLLSQPQLCEDELRFCYLGSINHIIDIDFIANFLKECSQYRRVSLHLIGDGESKKQLIECVRRYGIVVQDHGRIYEQEAKQKIFDQCNYAFNVMKESVVVGLTMKSLDYMCGQIPLVNTIGGDTRYFCETKNIGFHVPHDQIGRYAQILCSQTLQEQRQQRDNIRCLYLRHFTKESFFRTLTDSLEKYL